MALNKRMYEILHEFESEYGKNSWINSVDDNDPRLLELHKIVRGGKAKPKLDNKDVPRIKAAIESGFPTSAELARKFNCSQSLMESFIRTTNELRWAWKVKNRNKLKVVLIKNNQATILDSRQRAAEKLDLKVSTVSFRMSEGLSTGGYDIVRYPDYLRMKRKSKPKVIKKAIASKPKVHVKKTVTHLLREKAIFKR